MSGGERDTEAEGFDMAIEPSSKTPVVQAEEDENAARARDAALASTFDPERAHAGKSEEELIAEREAQAREIVDAAIALGVIVAVVEANDNETTLSEANDAEIDDGGE